MKKRPVLSEPHHAVFNYETASVAEVAAEARRRAALRDEGLPFSVVPFPSHDPDTTAADSDADDPMLGPQGPKMNKLETRYGEYLEARKLSTSDLLMHWEFAPMRLRLADGTFYKPDFLVVLAHESHPGYRIQLHETKGFMREAARVRLNVASRLFWWADFFLVKWIDRQWQITPVPK